MFHSEILASLNFNKNKMLSPGLKNNHTLKCFFLAIFHHNNICQDCWKNIRSTFECMVILQSRGQGPEYCWKYRTDLSRWSPSVFGPCPLDLRITIRSNVDLVFFLPTWYLLLCWKITRTTFQCMVVFQSRGQNVILVEIEWSHDLRVEHMYNLFVW